MKRRAAAGIMIMAFILASVITVIPAKAAESGMVLSEDNAAGEMDGSSEQQERTIMAAESSKLLETEEETVIIKEDSAEETETDMQEKEPIAEAVQNGINENMAELQSEGIENDQGLLDQIEQEVTAESGGGADQ